MLYVTVKDMLSVGPADLSFPLLSSPSLCPSCPQPCCLILRSPGCRLGAADQGQKNREREGRRCWRGRQRREVCPPTVAKSNPTATHNLKSLPFHFLVPLPQSTKGGEMDGGGGGITGCCRSDIRSWRSIVHPSSHSPPILLHLHSSSKAGGS